MQFLQQLDEAANIPVDVLKDKMKKDPRVKQVFQRALNVDELKDPAEFIRTLRYYIFSNPQVRAHVDQRADARDVSKHWWKRIAATKPTDELKQIDLDWLQNLVKDIFKDVGQVQKGDLSKRAHDVLHVAFSRHFHIDAYTARELGSLNLKPSRPITVYHGFHFDERSLKAGDNFLSYGTGLKFLKSIREGTRVVDLDLDDYTAWTKDRDSALRSALYGRDDSWRGMDSNPEKKLSRHGAELGFVVSTLAEPEDVVVDMQKFGEKNYWPQEAHHSYNTVILKPGKRLARVVSKHTKAGEVDPTATEQGAANLDALQDQLSLFAKVLKLPFAEIDYRDLSWGTGAQGRLEQIKLLLDPAIKEKIGKLLNSALSYFKKYLADLDLAQLTAAAGANSEAYNVIKQLHAIFDEGIAHPAYADPNSPQRRGREAGYVKIKDLASGDQLLTSRAYDMRANELADIVARQKRWTQWNINGVVGDLARVVRPGLKLPEKLHLTGWKVQGPLLADAVTGFFQLIDEPVPATHAEQAKRIREVANEASRTAAAATFLQKIKAAASGLAE